MTSCIPGKDANKAVMRAKSNATFNGGSDYEEDITIMPANPALFNQVPPVQLSDSTSWFNESSREGWLDMSTNIIKIAGL